MRSLLRSSVARCRSGGIGRRARFRAVLASASVGSSPTSGTNSHRYLAGVCAPVVTQPRPPRHPTLVHVLGALRLKSWNRRPGGRCAAFSAAFHRSWNGPMRRRGRRTIPRRAIRTTTGIRGARPREERGPGAESETRASPGVAASTPAAARKRANAAPAAFAQRVGSRNPIVTAITRWMLLPGPASFQQRVSRVVRTRSA